MASTNSGAVRIDKWLMAARFFKTRQLAIEAIEAGRVHVNDQRAKPAKAVRCNDILIVRKPPYEWQIAVTGLAEKRGSAAVAATLYRETPESVAQRETLRQEQRALPPPIFPGRPTKRARRMLEQFLNASSPNDE